MSTFEKQFGHLKETDPIAYYELKGNPCGTDSDPNEAGCALLSLLIVGLVIGLCFLAAII